MKPEVCPTCKRRMKKSVGLGFFCPFCDACEEEDDALPSSVIEPRRLSRKIRPLRDEL